MTQYGNLINTVIVLILLVYPWYSFRTLSILFCVVSGRKFPANHNSLFISRVCFSVCILGTGCHGGKRGFLLFFWVVGKLAVWFRNNSCEQFFFFGGGGGLLNTSFSFLLPSLPSFPSNHCSHISVSPTLHPHSNPLFHQCGKMQLPVKEHLD